MRVQARCSTGWLASDERRARRSGRSRTGRQARQGKGGIMRKFAIIAATLGLLAGATGGVSIASAAPHSSAAPHGAVASSARVLHLISRQTSLDLVDLGKKGRSPGDQIMETTADFQNGKLVDHSFLNCVGIKVTAQGGNLLCHGAMVFANGQVQIQGETDF